MDPMLALPIVMGRNITQPMVDAAVRSAIADPNLCFTQKVDGHRKLVTTTAGRIHVWNRDGVRTDLPRHILAEVAPLAAVDLALDGELLDGTLWLFDMPQFPGEGVTTKSPLTGRLEKLHQVYDLWQPDHVRLLETAWGVADKTAMLDRLRANNAEGAVAKHRKSPYQPGVKSPHWTKIKFTSDVDCVVHGLRIGGKNNIGLSMYKAGKLVPVGEVTALNGDGPAIVAAYQAEQGKARPRKIVVKVKVLYSTHPKPGEPYGRLYQPTLARIRTDKKDTDCTIDQLDSILTNKSIITTQEPVPA